MKITLISIIFVVLLSGSDITLAGGEHQAPQMPGSFNTMKKFLGTWEGRNVVDGEEKMIKSVYKITSGGTAVQQLTMAGSPGEMVSIYHRDGDSLSMTHYCSLGNQPFMSLVDVQDNMISFKMNNVKGISSIQEPHIHAVTISLLDNNTLREEWVYYVNGVEKDRSTFTYNRME